ncbi:hypothetical protein LDENG_00038680 [Lucifuga dentata]|nr:hypothetical protein LDENG_00038680 [Lucifuga dentata]
MGSGTSRGKKVAPACVNEVNVTKTTASVTPRKQDSRSFKPLKIHAILRNARNRAQPDCHSEGHDSEFSAEEADIDGGLGTVLVDYKEQGRNSEQKTQPKKFFIRSKTYGLCHFSRGGAEEPRGSHRGCGDVNKMSNSAFSHFNKHTPPCPSQHRSSSQAFLTRGPCTEVVPTSEKQRSFGSCHSSSLTPVILYDGSEEELMDTIEREFS